MRSRSLTMKVTWLRPVLRMPITLPGTTKARPS